MTNTPIYRELKSPVTAQMALTELCNNVCRFCYNSCRGTEEQSKGLGLEDSLRIAKSLVDNDVFEVVLTGGEPLLRRDLLYAVGQYLSSNGVCVPMNSNLVLVNEDDTRRIKDSGIKSVFGNFSSHNRDTYNMITQTENYDKTIRGIETLLNADISLALNMVVTKLNRSQVYETGKFVHLLGMNSFCATPAAPCEYMSDDAELSSDEVVGVLDDLLRLRDELDISVDVVEPIPRCIVDNPEKYEHFFRRDCAAGKTTVYISPDGDVTPCTHVPTVYGNLLTDELSDVWKKMAEWRNGSFMPSECRNCEESFTCSTGCREGAKIKTGKYTSMDMWAKDPVKQRRISLEGRDPLPLDKEFEVVKGLMIRPEEGGHLIYNPNAFTITYASEGLMTMLTQLKSGGGFTIGGLKNRFKNSGDLCSLMDSLNERRIIK